MKMTVTRKKINITDGFRENLNRKVSETITDLENETGIHNSLSAEKYRQFPEFTVTKVGCS